MSVHDNPDRIATMDASIDTMFRYMSTGNHHHAAFKKPTSSP